MAKKLFAIALVSFSLLFVYSGTIHAAAANNFCDESVPRGTRGLVPCGRGGCYDRNICVDPTNNNEVPCDTPGSTYKTVACTPNQPDNIRICRCEIVHFFSMLIQIFRFIVLVIATPLAGLLFLIGGILILLSGINTSWYEKGKDLIKVTVIALLLIFGSWIIINVVLNALGYAGAANWWQIF